MKKAYLHSQIRKQIPLPFATYEVAQRLKALRARVDTYNIDIMPFVLEKENLYIEGVIERWQGTESRLRFEGELSIAPFESDFRTKIGFLLGFGVL